MDPCNPEPSVVIVGAGVAGLSAAQRLAHCGISNFTVLEATERPGGRIHSCWIGDVVAELGAEEIKGSCIGNPMFNLAVQGGLIKTPLIPRDKNKRIFCTSDGRAIDTKVSSLVVHMFKTLTQEASTLFAVACGQNHGSLFQFLSLRIQQELLKLPEDLRYDAARIMYGMLNNLKGEFGECLSTVSADNFGSVIHIPGGDIQIPLGLVGVLAPLLRELPECSVKFGKPVGLIRWGALTEKGPRAIVQCCDGEEYCADYVIVTVSLGVLKAHADKLFCPTLPANKIEAIKKLGYGHYDKIYMDYERPFWIWNNAGIRLAWAPDELSSKSDWTKGIIDISEVQGSKHVLCAYVAGPEAVVMEHLSDEQVAEHVTKTLRQFTGDSTLPYPNTLLRTKWTSDPYFCGAFSYMNMESTVGHFCDLSCPVPGTCEPVPPILLFAGEATCAGHQSTMQGARLSGIREAERILRLTKKFNGPPPKN